MPYFRWTSDIALGHTEIDEQHKRLLVLGEAVVEQLINSAEHRPGAVQLQVLIDFAQEHFVFEESLMHSVGYPEGAEHAKYHNSLLTELRTYCYRVQRGVHTNPVALIGFLWSWIVLHIDSADRNLVAWLKTLEPDAAADDATVVRPVKARATS